MIGAALKLAGVVLAMTMLGAAQAKDYDDLVALFADWRAFEQPETRKGAPDYSAEAMRKKAAGLEKLQARLDSFDVTGWSTAEQVDWNIVRAEMNGMKFNLEVLRPFARDPAYYKTIWTYESDTPAHEGPTHHAVVELWTYDFPLTDEEAARLTAELGVIPPLNAQAKKNLTGNARDLWLAGTKTIEEQAQDLRELKAQANDKHEGLHQAIDAAIRSTDDLAAWLGEKSAEKTGPSGIGRENYTWYLQNVHLVPLTWEDEVMLMKRELKRVHAALAMEQHRNRDLPPLPAASSPEEYDALASKAARDYVRFLDEAGILTVKDYHEPALLERIGEFLPEGQRNFFDKIRHQAPGALWIHFHHWFDLARIKLDPHESPIRRSALLYNIFDSRAEGVATGMEELMMHAGFFDDNPRARELVWIMQAQRAARGLASLYAHDNQFTMKEASDFHVEWTPQGWMDRDQSLLGFEQQLYLRQPGYGTSYLTGAHLLDDLIADYAKMKDGDFTLRAFMDEMEDEGVIPLSLIKWSMTGERDPSVVKLPGAGD